MYAHVVLKLPKGGGSSPSVYMDEGFKNGGMDGFQHYDGILVVFRLSK